MYSFYAFAVAERAVLSHGLSTAGSRQQPLGLGRTNSSSSASDAAAISGRHRRESVSAYVAEIGARQRDVQNGPTDTEHSGRARRWALLLSGN